ncbi:hypothetical protein [Chlorogloeopsis fritschii]|uniref:hypothetical protein n=1 Tax=Chlorogloeopsis fritschii TaxID=1124 RepID=UPI001F1A4E7A|nr:hypothetical protein [Chlorogloeopsis fritschii]
MFFRLIWFLSHLKSQLLQALPDEWKFEVAVLADYPLLNLSWLREQTSILESLGFVQLMDYKVEPDTGFARCFAHLQHYCLAEICQIFGENGETIVQSISIFSILEQDWVVGAINREVNQNDGIAYIWRHPKKVGTYYPNISLDEFLQAHLRFRQQMLDDLGITVSTDVSWFAFRNLEQQATIYRKQTMRRKPLFLSILEATLFELNPKSEWLGDYPKEAVKRRANHR